MIYSFTNKNETFTVKDPHQYDHVYFPLTDSKGRLLSAITPYLSGDIKKDNDSFLSYPQSVEDLKHNFLARRDFVVKVDGRILRLSEPADEDTVQCGFLYQKLFKKYNRLLDVEITNFIPHEYPVEVMRIRFKNNTSRVLSAEGFSLQYIYARSAENLRDHRHVTSLLQRVRTNRYGCVYSPTMVFNEKGHRVNTTEYFVYGCLHHGTKKYLPRRKITDFNYLVSGKSAISDHEALARRVLSAKKDVVTQGVENAAVLVFPRISLRKDQEAEIVILMGIDDTRKETVIAQAPQWLQQREKIDNAFMLTTDYWTQLSQRLTFSGADSGRNSWIPWVSIQPVLRKLFGCSFLPHFDYGKGGRGWRDLWQDALTLCLIDAESTRDMIIHNYKGIRIDGSNATIIAKNGDFISDRNNISRVWMDHGVWPFLTTKLYMHQTGDTDIISHEVSYYRDHQLRRSKEVDRQFQGDALLKDALGNIYTGTVLEHILVQNLVQFFNVGEHNSIKLESADWNDGMDMAGDKGESVAFSCMYAWNLKEIADLLEKIPENEYCFCKELLPLLDTISGPVNYNRPADKQERLNAYFDTTKRHLSGKKISLKKKDIIADLRKKADWMYGHIRKHEWVGDPGMFNGYYDNHGERVEKRQGKDIRMTLTGQAFPLMSGIATVEQSKKVFQASRRYLYDTRRKGFRLNTDFKGIQPLLGRAFSFLYGDKENGAFFSHMNVMFANALYRKGLAREGSFVLNSIISMAMADASGIYPNLPEYVDSKGRGKYCYLTGSASWFMYTVLQEVFGIKGDFGDLVLAPRLTKKEFLNKQAVSAGFFFAGKRFTVIYRKKKKNEYPRYRITSIRLNQTVLSKSDYTLIQPCGARFSRGFLAEQCISQENILEVELS